MGNKKPETVANFIADPRTVVVQLSIIILGLAFGFGIQNVVENPLIAPIARCLALFLLMSVWFQIRFGLDMLEVVLISNKWFFRVVEFYMDMVALISPMVAAVYIQNEIAFYAWITVYFTIVCSQALIVFLRFRFSETEYLREQAITKGWVQDSLVPLLFCLIIIVLRNYWGVFLETTASVVFFLGIFILILWEYSRHRDFYFGIAEQIKEQKHK